MSDVCFPLRKRSDSIVADPAMVGHTAGAWHGAGWGMEEPKRRRELAVRAGFLISPNGQSVPFQRRCRLQGRRLVGSS